jgi:hypothetical protein
MSDIFGGSGGTVQTQQNNSPWAPAQQHLTNIFGQAEQLANGRAPYSFAPSAYTQQAQQMQADRALDPNSLTARAQGTLGDTISGKYLDPSSNPYLSQYVNDALGQVGSKFEGMYGGQAGGNLGNSGYQEQLGRTMASAALPIYANAYQQERGNQLNATQLAPQLDYANINQLGNVGAAQEARSQAQYNSPWDSLRNYQSAVTGNFGGQGSNQNPYFTNPMANALGMGIGGMGLYNMMGGMFGGGGAGLAGMGGGLLGSAGVSDLLPLLAA